MTLEKPLSVKKVKKLINLSMAFAEEPVKSHDQLIQMLGQYGREMAKITKGMNEQDAIQVYKTGFKQIDQFKNEPHLKFLFRGPNISK